jgi:amino acid adenylation domain-containing protein/non-ribosomal peptide synthase protein (TIGR01720 family)
MSINKEEILKQKSRLSPAKQKLLEKRLLGKLKSESALNLIPRRSSTIPPALSFSQQRLWFLQQLEPDNSFYNEHSALQLRGNLHVAALEQSLNEIIQRHEVLRTTFELTEDKTVQVIAPNLTLTIPAIDLRQLAEAEQQLEIQRLSIQQSQEPFDLVRGPLLRWMLLQISDQVHVLLFSIHHTIFDGWSIGLLIHELSALYQEFTTGKPASLSELPIQYADFAVWQRQHLQEKLESQVCYWKGQLKNYPPLLQLPTDRSRPPVQSYRGARLSFLLPKSLTQVIEAIAHKSEATLFMTLLAAFKILLYRYTGQEDIIVGSPVANRTLAEVEKLIGCFINTLVFRTDCSGNPTFEELLSRVRKLTIAAYANQDVPFEKLVEELQVERNVNYNPIFQVSFALQNTPKVKFELPELTITPFEVEHTNALFDLHLDMTETDSGLEGFWEYNTDLFERATIERLSSHFQTLLTAIADNPQQRIAQLPLLTQAERHQLLVEWNNTEGEYPNKCLHQLFEEQVEKTPDAVAVVFAGQQLTYRQLNAKANQLARYLSKKLNSISRQPSETLIGICLERSLEMLVGILGILKVGCAYIPIDPNYASSRINYILSDAEISLLVTQAKLNLQIPSAESVEKVLLDTDWQLISTESNRNLACSVNLSNLAYGIYTSGSTGKPKGVLIQHNSVVNFVSGAIARYQITQSDRVLQFASISFDVAVEEIYPSLITGGTVILAESEMFERAEVFISKCRQLKISVLDLPTAYWQQLIAEIITNQLTLPECIRLVIIGGEQVNYKYVRQWQDYIGNVPQLINAYGPTEATVETTVYSLTNESREKLPIGKPLPNVRVYVLDSHLQPVPIGVVGELYIGGVGIARGYLNRPELTAEKFIANPYSDHGARLYRTGDLVRYLTDGNLEFLGRVDHQVKIRGFRIELGEIEAVLSQHRDLRETVVVVRQDDSDRKQLVAYIVPEDETVTTKDLNQQLRNYLSEHLPKYMLPSAFVRLPALPLTPSGKVDRQALPVPDQVALELEETWVAPQTILEKQLAAIWAEVLGLEDVGLNDNFFALGGDSILAILITSKSNQAGIQLSVKQLFQHQTVAELAAVAVTKKENLAEQGAIAGLTPFTPIQHWFFEQNLPEPDHYNQSVLLEVKQVLDLTLLEKSVGQLLLHHDALRLRFEKTASGWQQIIAPPDLEVPLIQLDFSGLSATERETAIASAANKLQASLDLLTGQLMKVAWFDLGEQGNRLLIVIHHLAVDGVSWRILLNDLETVYLQLSQGNKARLPLKTTSFKHWSQCLQEYASSTRLQSEWDYWLRESWQQVTPFPVDLTDGDNTVASLLDISGSLTVEQTEVLLKEVPKAYKTQINDVLLTALVRAFAQWTGNNSLLLALEGHGREEIFERVDLSRTVAWFTSIFPVQLNLETAWTSIEALRSIKEQLQSIPNQGISYGILRYLSQDEEKVAQLRSHSQPQVAFNYLGQFDQTFADSSIFKFSQDFSGQQHSPLNREIYLLNINAFVINNQLTVSWQYSETIYRRSTIERLAQAYLEALQTILADCQADETEYTPFDFPDANLSQQNLDRFLAKIK